MRCSSVRSECGRVAGHRQRGGGDAEKTALDVVASGQPAETAQCDLMQGRVTPHTRITQ